MKKILALLAVVLGVVSCQTEPEGLDVNVGGEVETTVCVSLPEATRAANSAVGAFENLDLENNDEFIIRYIFQVFYQGEESGAARQVIYTDKETASFPVRLVPGRHYNFVVWADVVPQTTTMVDGALVAEENTTLSDYHYNTADLKKIQVINTDDDEHKWEAMDETRDAFTGFYDTAVRDDKSTYSSSKSINFTLTRPFAKLRVVTTDMEALRNLAIAPEGVTVRYSVPVYNSFNAFAGTANTTTINHSFEYDLNDVCQYENAQTSNNLTLFADYLFGADNGIVKFYMDVVDTNDTRIKENTFSTDIHVQRNYLTTIQGNILTDGNNVTVTVEENGAFANDDNPTDEPYYYQTISSEAELLDAIEDGGEYIVVSDIEVTGLVASTQAATRAAGDTTINLNGYTITLKADIEVESGKNITITDINENGEVGAIVSNGGAIVNEGTLNIEGGRFGADTIENNNGVVNITGGTFESNPSNFVDDDYAVVENNGEFTLVQKEEAVKINDTIYRSIKKAVAAAQNGDTVVFIADVEQADGVVITDKNITIDLDDYTFTVTEGANTNNRNFKVNGSSVVTIKNGIMVAAGEYSSGAYGTLRTEGTANVTLEDVKLYNYRGNGLNVKVCTGTTVTINNSEIYSQYGGGVEAAGGTVELNDVKIEQNGVYHVNAWNSVAIGVNGNGKVTVNSGNYFASAISTDANAAQGNWVAFVMTSGGTLDIKGGTFNGVVAETAAAANACGLICADTKAVVEIHGGTFNSNGAILDMRNNTGGQNPKATLFGGTFSADPRVSGLYASNLITVAEGYVVDQTTDGKYTVVKDVKVAKVGNTEYRKIDEAIAAWTNNTTLTLMSNVELSDVIKISSTEMHTLELGTYTMTAAKGKNAIEIINNGRSKASYALDIKADATNPGGITATSKAVVKTTGKSGVQDRPIIRFYNGVFNASNIVSHSGSSGTNCPQFQFHNGVYNGSMSANRALFQFYGGTFNGKFYISVDSSAYTLISGGKFKYMDNLYGSALNSEKFTIGSTKKVFDRGVYVDAEGYIVVGGPVITEFGDKFAAKATNVSKAGTYLPYSSAETYGLYYEVAQMAIDKHGAANVVVK